MGGTGSRPIEGEILNRQRQERQRKAREFAENRRKEEAEAAARDLRNILKENEAARMIKTFFSGLNR